MTHEATVMPDAGEALRVLWTGRSGRRYVLTAVRSEGFALNEGQLYVLAANGMVTWAGTAQDLVADHASRARFRAALGAHATIMTLPAPADELARMTLVWDLEGTHQQTSLSAA